LRELDSDNWLEIMKLSVSEEQKKTFPIPNVYWLGISRYEEHTTLYAIMCDDKNIGLIGIGYDEDGTSGFINPFMIDERYQGFGFSKIALSIAIDKLKYEYRVSEIHIGHRKENSIAGKIYEEFNFVVVGADEQDYFRSLSLEN